MKKILYRILLGFSPLRTYLAINITNVCNRSCGFCPYHSPTLPHTQHNDWVWNQPDHIDTNRLLAWFIRIGLFRLLIKHIAITGKGEPMMHPEFIRICRIIDGYGIPFSVTTNGDKMRSSVYDELSGMKNITGIRVSVYDHGLAGYWLQYCRTHPLVTLFNQTGSPHIDGMADGYTVYCEGNERHSMARDFNTARSCRTPYSFLTINTDCSVVPCYSYHPTGTLDDSWMKIWNGRDVREYRRKALNGRVCPDSDCKNCGVNL